jgi:hypothetical protein
LSSSVSLSFKASTITTKLQCIFVAQIRCVNRPGIHLHVQFSAAFCAILWSEFTLIAKLISRTFQSVKASRTTTILQCIFTAQIRCVIRLHVHLHVNLAI